MVKTAFVFPGQGSQKVGMLKELAGANPSVMAVIDRANGVLGRDLKTLMFEGPEDELKDTRNTQPALYVSSLAALEAVKEAGWKADFVAGHSLGEYSALAAAGAIPFEEGLQLVQARAEAMAEAGKASGGAMAAVLGLQDDQIRKLCEEASGEEKVQPANFNCPGQVVVSGAPGAVEKLMELAKGVGAKRCMALPVSGAFHSVYMEPAGEAMRSKLEQASWQVPNIPVVANVSAKPGQDPGAFAKDLVAQISGSVLWTQSIEALKAEGVERYLEIGSGKVLSGLIKKIHPGAVIANVEDTASLAKAKEIFDN